MKIWAREEISTVSANSYAGARDLMKQSRVKYTTSKPATLETEHPKKKLQERIAAIGALLDISVTESSILSGLLCHRASASFSSLNLRPSIGPKASSRNKSLAPGRRPAGTNTSSILHMTGQLISTGIIMEMVAATTAVSTLRGAERLAGSSETNVDTGSRQHRGCASECLGEASIISRFCCNVPP